MKSRKNYSILLSIVLIITLLGTKENLVYAMEEGISSGLTIPAGAYQYVNSNYLDSLQVFDTYDDELNIEENELANYTLGNPFIIYNLNESQQQNEIYYFPICNCNNQVVLVFSVIGTDVGWTHCVSEEMVDALNEINYSTYSNYIFYKSDNNLVAEDKNKLYIMTGSADSSINNFSSMRFERKKKIISEVEEKFIKTNVTSSAEELEQIVKDKYSPSLSVSTSQSTICELYNKKGQGNYGACWAASVATIVNYQKGKNITFKTVCDNLDIGYNEGGSVYEAYMALQKYGIEYPNINLDSSAKMSWENLKMNIQDKYPVYVSCNGHAVTAYGYEKRNNMNYVCFWNSGLNSGSGGTQVVPYKSSGTTFTYANSTWTWRYSLSNY